MFSTSRPKPSKSVFRLGLYVHAVYIVTSTVHDVVREAIKKKSRLVMEFFRKGGGGGGGKKKNLGQFFGPQGLGFFFLKWGFLAILGHFFLSVFLIWPFLGFFGIFFFSLFWFSKFKVVSLGPLFSEIKG